MVVKLGSGVHEVVGSWTNRWGNLFQKMLSVPCNNLSFVGQGEGESIVGGGFVVENGRKIRCECLTVKNSSGCGLVAYGAGTEIFLENVTVKDCQGGGVHAGRGAKVVGTDCQFCRNGGNGVYVQGSTTTACLTNCTIHHNYSSGLTAYSGVVVDLMGEGTSVHDNGRNGLDAYLHGATINVYLPCVLNDMSHGNGRHQRQLINVDVRNGQNIKRNEGGIIQQKDSKK